MSDAIHSISLTACSPLGGLQFEVRGLSIAEINNYSLTSLAVPRHRDAQFARAVADILHVDLPRTGHSVHSADLAARLIGLSPDQFLLLIDNNGPMAMQVVAQKLQSTAYLTDQTDGWVMIQVSGGHSLVALERICPLDLHADSFPTGACSRTVMEHLGTIILKQGDDDFLLLSARSSAQSFWHMIKTSVVNIG